MLIKESPDKKQKDKKEESGRVSKVSQVAKKKKEIIKDEEWSPERIKAKKSNYITNCLKKNGHYTEEKLNSLRWLKKTSSEPTRLVNEHVLEKYRIK